MGKTVSIGISLILLTVGLGIAFHNVRKIVEAKAREGAKAPAKIVLSQMIDYMGGGTVYKADIEFEFFAYGELIVGGCDQIRSHDPSKIRQYLRKYKKGQEVLAYYNPKDPYDAVLEPGIPSGSFIGLGISLVLICPGIIGLLTGLYNDDDTREKNREQPRKKIFSWKSSEELTAKLIWIGFTSMTIIVGLLITYEEIQAIVTANNSKNWLSTQAEIVLSTMKPYSSKYGTNYTADVEYTYFAGDQLMTGDRIRFGGVSTSMGDNIWKYLRKYKKGNLGVVFYNPNDPQDSVLEPGIHTSMWYDVGFSLIFVEVGLFFMLAIVRTS